MLGVLLAVICGVLVRDSLAQGAKPEEKHITVGWYPSHPYQYLHMRHGTESLTGLDIELTRKIFERRGYTVNFVASSWVQIQKDLRDGKIDMALGAYDIALRQEYALFSDPYRTETDSAFFQSGAEIAHNSSSFAQLVENIATRNGQIGILDGYSYGAKVDDALAGLPGDRVIRYENVEKALQNLADGRIDALLSDQLFVEAALIRDGYGDLVDRHSLPVFAGAVHAIFAKKTVDPSVVEDFNAELNVLQKDGEYTAIQNAFISPIRFGIALSGIWFTALDYLGTVAFAISGVLLARREKYSIFGAFVLAALPGVGGGVVRDLITGREPIGIMQAPNGVLLVIATVLMGYLTYFVIDRFGIGAPAGDANDTNDTIARPVARTGWRRIMTVGNVVEISDAVGLAAFTVTGVYVAVTMNSTPILLWGPILAMLTGAGGGIIRDVVRADKHNPALKTSFYAEIPLLWGFTLSFFFWRHGPLAEISDIFFAVIITVIGAFVTRMVVLGLGLRSPRF
tara:strand:+ start:267 stop:1802 length:1536 start_codon:yes stop_codon:yes gene_type:complete